MSELAPKAHRGSIFLEDDAEILEQTAFAAAQYVVRIRAPKCAAAATPGSFAHLTCDAFIPMRRPLSIMRADAAAGWIDILYKVHGVGLHALAALARGRRVSVLGPIGNGFAPLTSRPRALLIGGGVGIPPLVFLAERMKGRGDSIYRPVAFFGSEIPFPFKARPSTMMIPGMPAGVIACDPLLEAWGVPSRLASRAGLSGCFEGYVTELAESYIRTLDAQTRAETQIFACGPTVMLEAVASLARRHCLPAQVSLEEFMACAVGGCAGCAVPVQTPEGPAMKRVCVDGPVFDAAAVFPAVSRN